MPIITVDFENKVAEIKPMQAVNNGPKMPGRSQLRHNFDTYKALRIPYARTHDASICYDYGAEHCVDVNGIFPNFDADVNDPANYDFFLTDLYLKSIMDAGTKVYYRLGSRIEHWDKKYNTLPPKDFKKWAEICEHIIAHYTEGWADGFNWDIEYWEIWNEPEVEEGQDPITKNTWGGTNEEFFDFFEISAKHLKKRFPHLKIGGPALCWQHDWGREFVKTMSERNVPLDFYSWHLYNSKIYKFKEDSDTVRGYLDEFGYTETESHLNEWNFVLDWQERFIESLLDIAGAKGAAYIMAAMIACQHSSVDMMMYYDARIDTVFNGLWHLITLEPQHQYYSLYYFSNLFSLENEALSTSDDEDIYSLVATDGNGKAGIIAYYTHIEDAKAKKVTLELKGCSDDFEFYEVSNAGMDMKIDVKVEDGKAELILEPDTIIYYSER